MSGAHIVELNHGTWHHADMIEFRMLADDNPDLAHSPLLRGALLTLHYAQEHGSIGLTQTKAFKRTFVHWAVENFDWPGKSAEEMFRYNKVINEFEFPPLELLHFLLVSLRLRPLMWAGLLTEAREDDSDQKACHVFKTPLWRW